VELRLDRTAWHPSNMPRRIRGAAGFTLGLCLSVACRFAAPAGCLAAPAGGAGPAVPHSTAFRPRAFDARLHGKWIGNAVAYGPHRDGQAPWGPQPSREQLREDLLLMAPRWNLIRLYGAVSPAESVLAIIRAERLPVRVMLGAWIAVTERRDSTGAVVEVFPAAREANRAEMAAAVRLASEYAGIVVAISVGNETQVSWSDHRVPTDSLIADLRWVRSRTRVPVTTADDFNFWNKPGSRAVADEVDFIVMHAHPMWNGKQLGEALEWTTSTVGAIRAAHPGRAVVLGETGWATRVHTEGEQSRLIKGAAGEAEQETFFDEVTAWARRTRTTTFFFEAFDENWKGGSHPNEVEKHWGLYRADRTPKRALATRP
jgi:exo-beta-1,3-glucanase (GH17 family)